MRLSQYAFLVAIAVALVIGGCGKKKTSEKAAASAKADSGDKLVRPSLGAKKDAKIEVLAFVDYACPFCKSGASKLTDAAAKHGKDIRFRILNLPLDVHENSVVLAKGAVAAAKMGKWRAYYDAMLATEKADEAAVLAWAKKAGLDEAKFKAALNAKATTEQVAHDVALANVLGVAGTPSFIVNGALVQAVQGPEDWAKIVAGQTAGYDKLVKGGATHAEAHWKLVQANSPKRAPVYKKHVLDGVAPPASPVPAKVKKGSGVVSAQIMPAGGGMGAVQVGQPVRVGEEAGDPKTVWRVSVRPDDPMRGAKDALVTMVIFEDFQCPYCKQLLATLKNVRTKVGDKDLRIVFKHNPLIGSHKHAMAAAEAAEAARAQGKFWELHDILFDNQAKIGEALRDFANQAGLEMAQYDNAMASHGAASRIEADMEQAGALGARGTPNIFINGRKLVGAKDADTLLKHINEALAEAKAVVAKGDVKAADYYDHAVGKGKLLPSLAGEAVKIDTAGAATRGPAGAAVHIVAFEDFQCPFCARLDQHIAAMEQEFPGRVKVTWMDFPLFDIHPNAGDAAQVGKEALKQGKFWQFHAALMADQSDLSKKGLSAIAKNVGMDIKKLDAAMKNATHEAAVAKERKIGEALGIKGTPTVFINGHKFTPQLGFSARTFRSAIRRLLGTRN